MGCTKVSSVFQQAEKGTANSFINLPTEIQIEIFSYLTAQQLCHSVAPVCKSWRILSKYPRLWKTLTIELRYTKQEQVDSLYNFLKRCNCLRDLTLKYNSAPGNTTRNISDCLFLAPMLNRLCLELPRITLQDVRLCLPLLKYLKLTKELALTAQEIKCIVSGCPLIEDLELNCSFWSSSSGVEIEKLLHLRSLYLKEFSGNFPCLPVLKRLRLNQLNIADDTLVKIATGCPLIEELEIKRGLVATELQQLSLFPHLTSLCLKEATFFCHYPGLRLRYLKSFSLEMPSKILDGKDLHGIVSACPLLEHLKLLCQVEEYALHYITKLRNLRSLTLTRIEYIGQFPSLPLLKKLHLEMPIATLEKSVSDAIVTNCPLIEDLELSCQYYVDVLYHIARLAHLRILCLKGDAGIDWFPKLPRLKDFYLEMPGTLSERALEDIVSFCPLIEELEFKCNVELTDLGHIQKLHHLRSFFLRGKNRTNLRI